MFLIFIDFGNCHFYIFHLCTSVHTDFRTFLSISSSSCGFNIGVYYAKSLLIYSYTYPLCYCVFYLHNSKLHVFVHSASTTCLCTNVIYTAFKAFYNIPLKTILVCATYLQLLSVVYQCSRYITLISIIHSHFLFYSDICARRRLIDV